MKKLSLNILFPLLFLLPVFTNAQSESSMKRGRISFGIKVNTNDYFRNIHSNAWVNFARVGLFRSQGFTLFSFGNSGNGGSFGLELGYELSDKQTILYNVSSVSYNFEVLSDPPLPFHVASLGAEFGGRYALNYISNSFLYQHTVLFNRIALLGGLRLDHINQRIGSKKIGKNQWLPGPELGLSLRILGGPSKRFYCTYAFTVHYLGTLKHEDRIFNSHLGTDETIIAVFDDVALKEGKSHALKVGIRF